MKLKVESIQLKTLLNEEEYSSGFSKIQVGDLFIVITDKTRYEGKVVDKYSTQIIVQILGKNYIITSNSMSGNELRSHEIVDGQRKPASITKNVRGIIIRRNGTTVTNLLPSNGRNNDGEKNGDGKNNPDPEIKPFYEEAYKSIMSVLKSVEVDNKLVIKAGELLITKDEIANETVITIDIHVRKILNDDIIIGAVTNIDGDTEGKYNALKEGFVKISISESVELTEKGVVMLIKSQKENKKIFVEGVFELNIGEFFNIKEPTFDDMMQDKGFRDLMFKKPGLAAQISGQMAKGVLPASEIIKKLGLTHDYYTKGKKVKFTYTGSTIRPGNRLSLVSGKEYIGIFSTSKVIKLTGERRGESLQVRLQKKIKDQIYEVKVTFSKIVNGQETTQDVGRGIIQITDVNFR